jgi:hypothetical protein
LGASVIFGTDTTPANKNPGRLRPGFMFVF